MAAGKLNGPITAINVTPLVDVVLVLLIVLMVTATSIAARSIPMDLPAASTGQPADSTLLLSLDTEGQLYVDGDPVDRPGLLAAIQRTQAATGDARAVIAADRRVEHGEVVTLMDTLRAEGISRFAIHVTPEPKP